MARTEHQFAEEIVTEERARVKEPPMYRVILLNDHYTTMEFVVLILQKVFNKSLEEANQIMLRVHESGSGTAGVYTREIAETKVAVVHHLAEKNEFPLKCRMEPVAE